MITEYDTDSGWLDEPEESEIPEWDDPREDYIQEPRPRGRKRTGKKKRQKQLRRTLIGIAAAVVLFALFELILPGSHLRRKEAAEETSLMEKIPEGEMPKNEPVIQEKKYDSLKGITEEQLLWDVLMEYFNGNKTAVLGVMCNLKAESRFKAACLEDYNKELWAIDDTVYTERVNRKVIERRDFLESRFNGQSNGYVNDYEEWVNLDGGYGYAQVTSYDKKEALYRFADRWFSPGGEGEEYRFNIGDPKMQAAFLLEVLDSEEYKYMNYMIRNAQNVVDACYYWLKYYEIPYDPYCDDYYTLAFERADSANSIRRSCDPDFGTETKDSSENSTGSSSETESENSSESSGD